MKKPALLIASAMAMALSMAVVSKAEAAEKEKCYGVAKAGKNDCVTANGSCAGSAKKDNQKDAYLILPKGTCDKIVGASLAPIKG
ncbi:MAG: BufA1 family periplasmic bufferin-type metallophore [Alphaproteobacteria bacterium]